MILKAAGSERPRAAGHAETGLGSELEKSVGKQLVY